MRIGSGEFTYEWHENWATIPDTESGRSNGRTHGVVVSKTGDVLVFNQAQPGVLRFDPDGRLLLNVNTPEDYQRARSIAAVHEGAGGADPGSPVG